MPSSSSARSTNRRHGALAVSGQTRSILRGELDKVGLPTLLTILEMERRSGVLLVQRGRELGRLYVREGQVIRAHIEGPRRPVGVDAVYAILAWSDGQFELWHAEVDGHDEMGASTAFLLMEGMRRLDEERAPARKAPESEARLALAAKSAVF